MIELLARLFIRGRDALAPSALRRAYGQLCGAVGIGLNLLLFAVKFFAGSVSGSIAITADAFNNLSDAGSSLVTLLGFRLAGRKPDPEHPFGHGRMEYISGLVVSGLILLMGVELGKSSLGKILHPEEVASSPLVLVILVVSIGVKLYMFSYNRAVGKKIHSTAMDATAMDSLSDAVSTAAVLVATLVGQFTGLMIDGWAGLLVALFILWSGVGVVKDTVDPLLGAKPDEELVRAIAYLMTSHVNILGFHDLMVHDYGPGRRFASVHAEIDHRIDPLIAHEILDEIERQAKRELHVDLVIHYDPIVTDDPEIAAVRTRVLQIMHGLDPRLSLHDFRMVSGQHHVNVIFDMVLPPEDAQTAEQLRRQIEAQLQDGKKTYHLIVTFDTAAFNELSTEAGEQQSR